jgi:hypothetical protein
MIEIKNNCHGSLPPGFFSNFMVVLDWLHNSYYNREKIFVNWSCNSNENLWDVFFSQPRFELDNLDFKVVNDFRCNHEKKLTISEINDKIHLYDKYNGWLCNNPNIFFEEKFQNIRDEFNKAYSTIEPTNFILEKVNDLHNKFTDKTLGVTVRIPLHYSYGKPEINPISNTIKPEKFYEDISEEILYEFNKNKYEKIFICCDVDYLINIMKTKISEDRLIYTNYNRLKDLNSDWIHKKNDIFVEYTNVLVDVLLLSKTNYIIGGSSNIFLSSLLINNKVNFKLFDTLKNLYGA